MGSASLGDVILTPSGTNILSPSQTINGHFYLVYVSTIQSLAFGQGPIFRPASCTTFRGQENVPTFQSRETAHPVISKQLVDRCQHWTLVDPAIVTPFQSQQSSHRSGAINHHTVPEPAIVTPHSVQNGEILQRNCDFFQNQTEWLELIFGSCPFRIWHFWVISGPLSCRYRVLILGVWGKISALILQ